MLLNLEELSEDVLQALIEVVALLFGQSHDGPREEDGADLVQFSNQQTAGAAYHYFLLIQQKRSGVVTCVCRIALSIRHGGYERRALAVNRTESSHTRPRTRGYHLVTVTGAPYDPVASAALDFVEYTTSGCDDYSWGMAAGASLRPNSESGLTAQHELRTVSQVTTVRMVGTNLRGKLLAALFASQAAIH